MGKNGFLGRIGIIGLLAGVMFLNSCQRSLTDYVNPFVGTDGHGHTFPGAVLPFGMVQASPDTRLDGWDGCSGYHYCADTTQTDTAYIYGFSHTHLSGTGCSDYGDLLIMPFSYENGEIPDSLGYSFYQSTFSHRNEKAEPGYYRVVLDRNRVMAELTVHKRSALHKYTFPTNGQKGVVIDLKHRDVVIDSKIVLSESTPDNENDHSTPIIEGYRISSAWNPEQHFYFAIAADSPIEKVIFYKDGHPVESLDPLSGEDCKALVFFEDDDKEVTLYVGISAVDEKGARNNLFSSVGEHCDMTFSKAKKAASAEWEKALSVIEVEGGSREDRRNFYTALYHCMTSPYLYTDADGRYRPMKGKDSTYSSLLPPSEDFTIPEHNTYTVFSVWDTYRALHPLLNIIDPERSRDFVLTMLDHYKQSGELTMWELSSHETHCMIGYHAVSVILDAYRTGVLDGLDEGTMNNLLDAMINTSNLPMLGRTEYARDNYLSSEYENESVSKTLEYAYDDWCIAMMANYVMDIVAKNHSGLCVNYWAWTSEAYLSHCQAWKNIMDENGFMHARRNGAFVTPFDPTEVNNHYTEANSWQYSTYVPHDVNGWIEQIGGPERAEQFLDSLFNGSSKMTGREQSDITGVIGQYAHGNEPSHHAAYLYAYLGRQWKTAELVRRICKELYHDTPDGLCGNEDCGQMSAWYVMSALGFYPVCPGSGNYVIGSPLFDKAIIHLPSGKDVVINAHGQGEKNCYVRSLKVNGANYDRSFITIEQLKEGSTFDFEMSSKADKEWASAEENRPKSPDNDYNWFTPAPVFDDWQQSISGESIVKIRAQGNDSIFYTLDGSDPTTSSTLYTADGITVDNDAVIKAMAYNYKTGYSSVVTHRKTRIHKDRSLTYITKPDPQYYENGETGLIDRLHGSENYRIGGWQGWQKDCEVVVDLLAPRVVSGVGVECLENMKSWIFFPTRVVVEISDDGTNYRPFGSVENTLYPATLERQEQSNMHNFAVKSTPQSARYVRIKAVNFGKLPAWHISAGNQAWLFVDEIEIY